MTFNLYVQQNQWVVVALLAGAGLMLLFWLVYLAMWRPREDESVKAQTIKIDGVVSFCQWLLSFMPWVLIIVLVISVIYTITHIYGAVVNLPNW